MSLRRLSSIVLKELRQLRRDRLTFAMIIGIPTMQLLLFGFAINLDVRELEAAVLDEAGTARSREAIAQLGNAQVIRVAYHARTPADVIDWLRLGRVSAAVVVPPDFEARLERGDRAPLQIVVDGSDQVVQQAARQLAAYPLQVLKDSGARTSPGVEIVNFYNPERRAPVNTVPGLIGVILTMTMVLFTAMALVRERERGNMEMLIATPVSPWELTLGKVLPFVAIGLVQVSVVLALGRLIFAVPVRGHLLDVYAAALVFILASLALGVFLSTLARSQFQSMQLAFFTFLPQILLSGFVFPYGGMPRPVQWLAEVLPLTHFIRLIRGIAVRGAGLAELWPELAALGVLSVLLLGASVARVRKRLD